MLKSVAVGLVFPPSQWALWVRRAEGIGQIGQWIDAIDLAGFHQAIEFGRRMTCGFIAHK